MLRTAGMIGVVVLAGGGAYVATTSDDRMEPSEPVMQAPAPTRAHGFREPIERVPREDVAAYARTLSFDSSRSVADARTVRDLMTTRTVLIAPERGAHLLTSAQLAQGRIIAFIRASAPWPRLGIPPGDSWLWADSGRGGWRWVVYPVGGALPLRRFPMRYETHPLAGPGCEGSGARILELGGWVWVACGCRACCCVQGTDCFPKFWGKGIPSLAAADIDPLPVRVDTFPWTP